MRIRSGLFISATLALLVSCPGPRAETAAQAISRWGLVGTWKLDCSGSPPK
jgi:hypothetical protein